MHVKSAIIIYVTGKNINRIRYFKVSAVNICIINSNSYNNHDDKDDKLYNNINNGNIKKTFIIIYECACAKKPISVSELDFV